MTRKTFAVLIACVGGFGLLGSGCSFVNKADIARYDFTTVNANASAGPGAPAPADLELRTKAWKHEWHCNYLEQCSTEFASSLYVFDRRNGKQIKWNRIEVFSRDDCEASTDDRRNYKTITDAEAVSIGWPKKRDGKYDKVSAFLVFYADWGNASARVKTDVCK